MSDIAVSVRGVSKSYTISHDKEKHNTLVGAVLARLKDPLRRPERETFWALKDVSFDIKKGDVVGIIGRNGAGKSTLLKILSRITEPTTGEIHVFGRIGSLLEVGTGFHPELTGRENVFLNGAILGMSKSEIRKQFDAIVDFAGVEKFLDTPVKRYSSGMYVRLAFAVAAHLNPEILIVDEVLAVGDAEFQKKCLGKMKDVSSQGRTVLFVSHSISAVRQLCTSAIFLEKGVAKYQGKVPETLKIYAGAADNPASTIADKMGRSLLAVESFNIYVDGVETDTVASGDDLEFVIRLRMLSGLTSPLSIGIAFENSQVGFVIINYSHFQGLTFSPENGTCRVLFNRLPIVAGQYQIHLRILSGETEVFWTTNAITLIVQGGDFYKTGIRGEEGLCPWLYQVGYQFKPSPTF